MELFLSLSNRPKKAPYTKHRIIDIFETTTSSIPETTRTVLSNYQRCSLPYKSSAIKDKTFSKSKQKINLKLRSSTELKFTKIKPSNNPNISNEIDSDDEKKIIESLQEGIKQLPNGKFCIQPGKIFDIRPKTNTTMINYSKSDITNANNSSTTICSNSNNTLLCKRISFPMNKTNKTRNTISTSSSMNNKVSSTKKIARRISPNYQAKAFTDYIRVNNIVSNPCTNSKSKAVIINTRETKRKMNIYKNHFAKKNK